MRTSTVLLLTDDYAERLGGLYAAAQAAQSDQTPLRVGEKSAYDELREEYDALKAEAERDGIKVTLRAVARPAFRDLKKKHPPRTDGDEEDRKSDRLAGVNTESVEDDLVYASIVEPEFKSRAAFDEWADQLSEGDWQTLVARAWELTNVARIDPKSLPALPTQSGGSNGG